ncbi:MAG TPA: hypothetical protein VIN77_13860 [Aurantimonas sp.]
MNLETDTTNEDRSTTGTTDGERLITHQQLADAEFEPLEGQPDLSQLPGNLEFGTDIMPTVRLAHLTLFKSKAELAGIFAEDEGETGFHLVEILIAASGQLKVLCDMLGAAEVRLMSAAATVFPEDGEVGQ